MSPLVKRTPWLFQTPGEKVATVRTIAAARAAADHGDSATWARRSVPE